MKKLLISFLLLLLCPLFVSADVIVFKNGNRIETKGTWKENGQIKCYYNGGIVGYPEELVERIEKVEAEPVKKKKVETKTTSYSNDSVKDYNIKKETPVEDLIVSLIAVYPFLLSSYSEDYEGEGLTQIHLKLSARRLGANPKIAAKEFSDELAWLLLRKFKKSFCIHTHYGQHNKLSRSCVAY